MAGGVIPDDALEGYEPLLPTRNEIHTGWSHPPKPFHTCVLPHPREIPTEDAVEGQSIWRCPKCLLVFTYQGIESPASQPPDDVIDQSVWTKPRLTPPDRVHAPPWAVVR